MKIESVELRRIHLPLEAPFRTSFGTQHDREVLLVRVRTPETDGWGECCAMSDPLYSSEYVDAAEDVLERFLIPDLLSQSEVTAARVAPLLAKYKGHRMAKAALEMAVLDAELRDVGDLLRRAPRSGPRPRPKSASRSASWTPSPSCSTRSTRVRRATAMCGSSSRSSLVGTSNPCGPSASASVTTSTAGRRQHRLRTGRRAASRQAGRLRPAAHRAAAGEEDIRRHAELASADRDTDLPRRVDRVGSSTLPTRSRSGPAAIINIKPGRVGGYLEAKKIHDVCRGQRHRRSGAAACSRPASAAPPTRPSPPCPASRCPATSRPPTGSTPTTSPTRSFSRTADSASPPGPVSASPPTHTSSRSSPRACAK